MDTKDAHVWTKEETKQLINQYELHPELWDIKSAMYKNRTKKRSAFKKLSELFKISEIEIQKKIHCLRTQFHTELRRIKAKQSCQDSDSIYESKWEYFPSLKFIQTVETTKTNPNSIDQNEQTYTIKSDKQVHRSTTQTSTLLSRKIKRKIEMSDDERHAKKPLPIMEKTKDEYQTFGDFIATEFRSLKSEENRNLLKRNILRAIMEVADLDANQHHGFNVVYLPDQSNSSWQSTRYSSTPPIQSPRDCKTQPAQDHQTDIQEPYVHSYVTGYKIESPTRDHV